VPAAPRAGPIADRTRARHADVHRLLAEGPQPLPDRCHARPVPEHRPPLRPRRQPGRAARNDGTGRRVSILDEHEAYLRERWNSGCTNGAQLWEEIHDRGYTGGRPHVRHYLARYRGAAATPAPSPVPPKVKAVTSWIMTSPDNLDDAGRASLDSILAASPELAAVTASVRAFAAIMNERRSRKLLEPWMNAALATGEPALRSFVTGLRADQDAVTNGLSLPWSSGAVEGHVNRIKMLKRQMYGRASPDLLAAAASSSPTNPHRENHQKCARARFRLPLTRPCRAVRAAASIRSRRMVAARDFATAETPGADRADQVVRHGRDRQPRGIRGKHPVDYL
jgi:hypothetical protein